MNVGEKIRQLRKQKGLTQEQLGDLIGVKKSAIAKYENNRVENLKRATISKLAKALDVSPAEFVMDTSTPTISLDIGINAISWNNISPITTQKIPVLGEIRCGEPTFAQEERLLYVMVGAEVKADFALICRGDSMIDARINDGDIVFIRKQDIVNNGEIAAVIIDDEATLKRFYYYRDKNLIILKPANSAYEDIILTGEQLDHVRVLGKAVAFQSDVE